MRTMLWAAVACALLLPAGTVAADSFVVDNIDAQYVEINGIWQGSSFGYQDSSRYSIRDENPMATARWTLPCSTADKYNTYYYLPNTEYGCDNAKYTIVHSAGRDSVYKEQNKASGNWIFLGAYDFAGDSSGYVEVVNDTNVTSSGYALWADAIMIEAVGDTQDIHLVYFLHDFGVLDIGDSSLWSFDFSNVGGDDLTVDSIKTSTAEFTLVDPPTLPLVVSPGATVDLTVKFLPFSGGNYADSVRIVSDDPDSTEMVRQVELVGTAGVLLVDDGDAGYSEPVGTTWVSSGGYQGDSRYALVGSDIGATAQWVPDVPSTGIYNAFYYFGVTGSSNSATAAKFKINHATGSDSVYRDQNLRSGERWQFLGQHPFNAGTSGNVQMINDSSATGWGGYAFRADAIKLEEPTVGPDLYVIDYSYDFGEVTVGQNKDWSFMAHNIGDSTVTIDSILTSNPVFSSLQATPTTIPAGGTLDIMMRFAPDAQVEYTGETVKVYSDDGDVTPSVILEGTGVGNLVIVDNEDGAPWYSEQPAVHHWHNSVSGYLGLSRYNNAADDTLWDSTEETATFMPLIPVADYYEVWWYIVNTTWVSESVEYRVHPSTGSDFSTRLSQANSGNEWKYLGTWYFDTDTSGYAQIVADTIAFDYGPVVRADAFKFIQAKGDTTPPETVTDLMGEKSADDINLSWTPVNDVYTGVNYYIIFRSTTPDFTPTSGDSIGEASTASYLDVGAAGSTASNYHYVVQAVDNVGLKGDYSNEVGEFDEHLSNVK